MPEGDTTKYFLINLIVQQIYREMLAVADEHGGKLPNRVMLFLDEIGTIPKIESAESSAMNGEINIASRGLYCKVYYQRTV